jgi:hypothetical protein
MLLFFPVCKALYRVVQRMDPRPAALRRDCLQRQAVVLDGPSIGADAL